MIRLPALALALAACNASPSAPAAASSSVLPPPPPSATPAPPETAAPRAAHLALRWDVPATWKPFHGVDAERDAIYRIEPVAGDAAPALVAAGTDGSVASIVDRWKAAARPAQPDAVRRAERTTPDFTVVTVEIHGANAVLGAIVLSPARAALEQELAREQKQLAELREKLTEQHPDVKASVARVEALQKRVVHGDEEGEGPMTLELRGPDRTVTAARDDWKRVVESFRLR